MVVEKMYIKWKLLLSFGTIFWILLCVYDMYFIDPITKFYYADSDEYGWLATVSEDEINSEPVVTNVAEDISFVENKYSFGECLLFWNIVIFLSTITFCIGSRLATNHLWPNNKTKEIFPTEINKKKSRSKIPVFSMGSKSITNMFGYNDCASLQSTTNLSLASSNGNPVSKHMEKQCAKLRDEMIAIQSTSLKEHATISKKLEIALREKRELCKRLNAINRESNAARQQVEQLLSEKCSLLERLECATKEFKHNTKCKKTALAKLEESQVSVALLMKEIENYRNEKNALEDKLKKLNMENQHLKDCITYYEHSRNTVEDKNVVKEQEKSINTFQEAMKNKNDENLSQSHKDVQRVQKRLLDLEKSLDKLKYTSWSKHNPKQTISDLHTEHVIQMPENDLTITTVPESPLEMSHKTRKVFTDNLTDEQRENIQVPSEPPCHDFLPKFKKHENLIEDYQSRRTYENPNLSMNGFDTENKGDFIFMQEVDDLTTDNDDSEEYDSQNRIISNSPAFQQFLHKMDKVDKLQAKFAIPTNMF